MNLRRIETEWEAFCDACFPPGLPKQQRIDLKRTFFGGAKALVNVIYNASDESDENLLTAINTELLMFNEDVKAGRQ